MSLLTETPGQAATRFRGSVGEVRPTPEEEYAMFGGLHGDPQAEGYGAIDVVDIDPEARSHTV